MSTIDAIKIEPEVEAREEGLSLEQTTKSTWQRTWPVIACGAGLFSDGYINGVSILFFLVYMSLMFDFRLAVL